MGFLDRFKKNKEKEQLEQLEKKTDVVEDVKKPSSAPTDAKAMAGKKAPEGKKKKASEAKSAEAKGEGGKEKASKAAKKTEVTGGDAYKVLVKPLVSEKSALQEAQGQYTFVVSVDANKFKIKQAVKEVYGVMPEKVRIMNMEGKKTRFGRSFGRRKDWKKAIVTLPKGRSINIHEGV